jgi:hypothetical protein
MITAALLALLAVFAFSVMLELAYISGTLIRIARVLEEGQAAKDKAAC